MNTKDLLKPRVIGIGISALVVIIALVSIWKAQVAYDHALYYNVTVEAGSGQVNPEVFRKETTKEIKFLDGTENNINASVPGTYPVMVRAGVFKYSCIINVADTTPPTADPIFNSVNYGETVEPDQCVANVKDVAAVVTEWTQKPDYNVLGRQTVTVALTDAYGNRSEIGSELLIIPTRRDVTVEIGSNAPASDAFILDEVKASAAYTNDLIYDGNGDKAGGICQNTPITAEMLGKVGDYNIDFALNDDHFSSILRVRDTVPPVLETQDVSRFITAKEALKVEDFVVSVSDLSQVTLSCKNDPEPTKEGSRQIIICATDEGGNVTEKTALLTLIADREAPVILGTHDINSFLNCPISYRDGIKVSDNCDEDIKLNIDAESVDIKKEGEYKVTYSATDRAGNETKHEITVKISKSKVDVETVNELAKEILDSILTPDMEPLEILHAIYYWIRGTYSYSEQDEKEDWLNAAYIGFTKHTGDCYIYTMSARALLENAGIKNMIIDTIPLRWLHYWNLVDIGEGWVHFDTTPRHAGGDFMYVDDERIQAYSNKHANSHIYDHERFPDVLWHSDNSTEIYQ
ncbi:MAG: transglutaminase domain-containing protein [Lachnospiraceae bacterium]|nr:transglutaminase domain-containing protein [Lachnospiraceae bacterium]